MVERFVCRKCHRDRKVTETRPTVLGDQDVVLDALKISIRVRSIRYFAYWADATV